MPTLSPEFKLREVFNTRNITGFADRLAAAWPEFDRTGFIEAATNHLASLGFKERSAQIEESLDRYLPGPFPAAAAVLLDALPQSQPEPGKTDWGGFIVLPQCAYVARRGTDHFDLGMNALYQLTKRFSAEGHLRAFLDVDYHRFMDTLRRWCSDPDPHVRRLVSEGTRPRLPMSGRIDRFIRDPEPLFELLEHLKEDESEYVRRSVANNLNDISKDHPTRVLDVLETWHARGHPATERIVRHGARTLIKQGHPRAIALLGFTPAPAIDVTLQVTTPETAIGGEVCFDVVIRSKAARPQRLLLDYVVQFMKANGSTSPKVFKWSQRTLGPGETLSLSRRQHLRQTSVRRLHPGRHGIALQVNGVAGEPVWFNVS